MSPLISSGDIVEVIYTPIENIKVGDIVLFENGNKKLTTHRVFMKGEATLITKGDFSKNFHDIIVTKENYLGLIIKLYKKNNININYLMLKTYFFLSFPVIKKLTSIKNILRK